MTCRSLQMFGSRAGRVLAGMMVVSWCGTAVAQTPAAQAPAAQTKMNMADHRGGVQGTVTDGAGAAVADVAVMAVNEENGAQFTVRTDPKGAYTFAALPVGKYVVSIASNGLTTFRRTGVTVAADATLRLDIRMDAATAAEAAEGERRELLQRIATLEQRLGDLESSAVLSEPETRVRRGEVFV